MDGMRMKIIVMHTEWKYDENLPLSSFGSIHKNGKYKMWQDDDNIMREANLFLFVYVRGRGLTFGLGTF